MIRALLILFIFLSIGACTKDDSTEDVPKDFYPPTINHTSPSGIQLYDKDFPIHITGSVVDSNLSTLAICIIDSLNKDTLYKFKPDVKGKAGYIYNEQYYNPLDSGYKHVYILCTDGANHKSESITNYFVY